jgi:hypothetical protein
MVSLRETSVGRIASNVAAKPERGGGAPDMTARSASIMFGAAHALRVSEWGRLQGVDDPDGELVMRAGQGDPAAAQALVARKLPRVLALAYRTLGDVAEAEDVAQEAMLKVWRHAPAGVRARPASTPGCIGWR